MFTTKYLLLICATAATAVTADKLNFLYNAGSYDDIQNAGSGYSVGFSLEDAGGNELWSSSSVDGYSPCNDQSYKFTMSSDCWSGTWTFGCETKFNGDPKLCAAYAPDDTKYPGATSDKYFSIGVSAGSSGTCGGSFDPGSDTCTSDSTFTVTGHYSGDLAI